MSEPQNEYITCFISVPPDNARSMARRFVTDKLAACVQIISPIQSIYRWEGEVREDTESLLLLKTQASLRKKSKPCLKKFIPTRCRSLSSYLFRTGTSPTCPGWTRCCCNFIMAPM
jgi:periplasmic divalent cation tolerance protein